MTKNKKHDQKGQSVSHDFLAFFFVAYKFEASLSDKEERGEFII